MQVDKAIRLVGLSKRYSSARSRGFIAAQLFSAHEEKKSSIAEPKWVLRDVTFDVSPGEVIAIVGANGAGKSTILKILAGVTKPTEGYAEVTGRIGSLLEVGTGFHSDLTGRENIFLNGSILGMSRREIMGRFDEIVEFSGVGDQIDSIVRRYSSGQYMRLGFAVASHLNSDILLVDEVLAVGDHQFRKKCLAKMRALADDGRTILFVSHEHRYVTELCSRAVWLNEGKIVDIGEPADIVARYEETAAPNNAVPAPV